MLLFFGWSVGKVEKKFLKGVKGVKRHSLCCRSLEFVVASETLKRVDEIKDMKLTATAMADGTKKVHRGA